MLSLSLAQRFVSMARRNFRNWAILRYRREIGNSEKRKKKLRRYVVHKRKGWLYPYRAGHHRSSDITNYTSRRSKVYRPTCGCDTYRVIIKGCRWPWARSSLIGNRHDFLIPPATALTSRFLVKSLGFSVSSEPHATNANLYKPWSYGYFSGSSEVKHRLKL